MLKRITGVVKHYEWGHDSKESLVYHLAKNGGHSIDKNESKYAELWLGTHKNGSSPQLMESHVDLPYLLKVLSIKKALSIQVHPDAVYAQELHERYPQIYTDPNAKHEIAIALTPFELFAGLQPPSIIEGNLDNYPEIKYRCKTIKDLLTINQDEMDDVLMLVKRVLQKQDKTRLDNLILRLYSQFGLDVGILCPIYMHYHCLQRGDAIYIPVGVPHAYMSGEIVEAMVSSDNVIRAALTPKFKDMDALFKAMTAEKAVLYPVQSTSIDRREYNVAEQFTISLHTIHASLTLLKINFKTIVLVLKGNGWINSEFVEEGQAFYVSINGVLEIQNMDEESPMELVMITVSKNL